MKEFGFSPEGWDFNANDINKIDLINIINQNKTIQGIVEECDDNCNLYVKFGNDLTGIIPKDEVEYINVDDSGIPKENICTGKVHKFVQFKIKEIDEQNIPILSRKKVQGETLDIIKSQIHPGEILPGIVKSIKPYGAFIEIGGGVVGLVHIEDLSVARIKSPSERLKIGQKINIMVKYIDKSEDKIYLSYKESFGTWEENANRFKAGMKINGIVRETEKNRNGIFIEILPNLVGMAEYKTGLEYGSNIDVIVKKIDYDKRKIKLAYC